MVESYLQKNSTHDALEAFKSNLTNLADLVKSLDYDTKFLNANKRIYKLDKISSSTTTRVHSRPVQNEQQTGSASTLTTSSSEMQSATAIYWMLQDPIDEIKCFVNRTIQPDIMTNRQIDLYNRAAINLLYYSPIKMWSSSRLVSQAFNQDSPDGFHIGPYALGIVSV